MAVSSNIHVDTFVKDPIIDRRAIGLFEHLNYPAWERFMDEKMKMIFEKGGTIVDIGGGLRIDASRGDGEDAGRVRRFKRLSMQSHVQYKTTDYTDAYHPDFVEDIHALSFADNSIDSIICIATLEHVYHPIKAAEEIVRVLKPGGMGFIYAPFVYRYHAHKSDYRDYYRYTKDGWGYLFRDCATVEISPVRGLFESLLRFTPLHRIPLLPRLMRTVDYAGKTMRAISEVQTSGYNVFVVK